MPDDHIVDEADVEWAEFDHGDHRFRRKQLAALTGSEELGCSLYEVPDGKRAWKRHFHTGNEEAMFVLGGEGTLFLGPDAGERTLSAGDFVALPDDESGTHAVEGGEGGLRYLMVSTMNEPDVTVYPDDGSVGLYAGAAPGGDKSERSLSTYLDCGAEVSYWDDE